MIIYPSAIVDHFQLTQSLAITKQDKEIIVNHDHSNNRIKKKKKKKNNNNTNDSDTTYTMKDYSDLQLFQKKVWWLAFPSDILYQTRSSVR